MHKVFILGDSTAAIKGPDERPETGWGEAFGNYLKPGYVLSNHAVNGRSTKDVIALGEFAAVLDDVTCDDIVLIQYGHNDEKLGDEKRGASAWHEFIANLLYMAGKLKEKGAKVIFITSIARRSFSCGMLQDTHGDWPAAMKCAAERAGVPCIDMTIPTMLSIVKEGEEGSRKYFMNFGPGEYENYPEGREDNTHLSPEGAVWIARMIAERLKPLEDCCEPD